jgi:nitrite reductase/ring-hydroxylating ferredoxin subunit
MKRTVIIFLLLFATLSCDDEYYSSIPSNPVYISLDLNFRDKDLNQALATAVFTSPRDAADRLGFGGVLVVNGFGEDVINLYAYDLACPEEARSDVRVAPDNTGLKAKCPKCGAVFEIAYGNGNPVSGSKNYLRTYKVAKTGDKLFKVYN